MKTKQLLEIALKITGIIFIVPGLLMMPLVIYSGFELFDSSSGIPSPIFFTIIIYILIIRYLVFRTDKIVNLIYKENDDDADIAFNFNRTNTIYLAIVISSLFGLIVTAPSFLVKLLEGKSLEHSIIEGLQILLMFLLITNATHITAWIEAYRKTKMQKGTLNNEDEDS